jgi:uncharacterized LabA/DUF88 family protein
MSRNPTGNTSRLQAWMVEDDGAIHVLLDLLYPGKSLAGLASRAGLSYPGHRIEKIPREELLAALAQTIREQPQERERILREILDASLAEQEALNRIPAGDVVGWLEGTSEPREGVRRLVAAFADTRSSVGRAARKWWRTFLAEQRETPGEEGPQTPLLDLVLGSVAHPVQEAARTVDQTARQLRDATRSLEESARRETQELGRHTAQVSRTVEALATELARTRSWIGEQQASVRRALEEVAEAIRALEARMNRSQSAVEGLVAQVGAAAVALERGQAAVARRMLAQLRSGPRRVGIFVDVANLNFSARDAHGARVQYRALRERGARLGDVAVARAYVVEGPVAGAQRPFEAALQHAGYDVQTLPVRQLPDGRLKANWDLGMATDMMRHADDLDVVLLATGDGDFVDLVRWLRQEGLQVHVASVVGHTSQDLVAAADGWIPLEGDLLMPASPRV